MASYNRPRAGYILDYENWDTIRTDHGIAAEPESGSSASLINVRVFQNYPLWVPMHRAFYRGDSINLSAELTMESHYGLYINDMFW